MSEESRRLIGKRKHAETVNIPSNRRHISSEDDAAVDVYRQNFGARQIF